MRSVLFTSVLACLLVLPPASAITLPVAGWSAPTHAALQALIDRTVCTDHGHSPIAAFDADGTLWAGDAYGAFSSVLVRKGLIDGSAAARIEHEYSRSEAQERKRWLLESLSLFGGLRLEQMQAAAEEAWVSCGSPGDSGGLRDTLRPEMANLVRCLRQAGWRVLMVTASPAEAVLRGAQALGIPEGDVFAIRLETDAALGTATGRPSAVMPLTWRDGKARALEAHGLAGRLALAVGNSMDDYPMIELCQANGGAGMFCVPRPKAAEDPWTGAAEGKGRLVTLAEQQGLLLHEASAGPSDFSAQCAAGPAAES